MDTSIVANRCQSKILNRMANSVGPDETISSGPMLFAKVSALVYRGERGLVLEVIIIFSEKIGLSIFSE